MKKILSITALALVIVGVCACGKMSQPIPVEGSGYPHTYPRK